MRNYLCVIQGQLQEAESWFQKAHDIDRSDSSVYQHYGQFLSDIGRVQEAAENYMKAVEHNGEDFELLFNTANALRCVPKLHLAMKRSSFCNVSDYIYNFFIPSGSDFLKYRQANRVHEAEVFYRKCVQLHPQVKLLPKFVCAYVIMNIL